MNKCQRCNSERLTRNPSSYTCQRCGFCIGDMDLLKQSEQKIDKFNHQRETSSTLMIEPSEVEDCKKYNEKKYKKVTKQFLIERMEQLELIKELRGRIRRLETQLYHHKRRECYNPI